VNARLEHVVTHGTFSLDGGTWEVDNNVWILGDDAECIVIDAAHDAAPILAAIGDRRLTAILSTHGHNDHIDAAEALADATGAPILLHPDDRMLWDDIYPELAPDDDLEQGREIRVAGTIVLETLHTPGHSPGACCFYWRAGGALFSGDTLFKGGPGATGRSYSHFPTIISSIKERLLGLPPETVVHTGHGDDTTIGDEAPHLDEWVKRGH
jgi:glyoxylase-like metal-dependent hydrolase (beta-lactamase superfamily II)